MPALRTEKVNDVQFHPAAVAEEEQKHGLLSFSSNASDSPDPAMNLHQAGGWTADTPPYIPHS